MSDLDRARRFIDVFELARTAGAVEGVLPVAQMLRLAPSLVRPEGELAFELRGYVDMRGRPGAVLSFRGQAQMTCDRCGAPVTCELTGIARFYFVRTAQELERIPVDESEDEPLLGSARFDLHELLEDEAILALPISPRHADCAAPALAPPDAEVGAADRSHPFAPLAQLKSRRQ
ncbi:MAG: YceD family protein [Burkholderiaceae bacterium]|nr:YceD family protein [Burkholderiaceae bacterium]